MARTSTPPPPRRPTPPPPPLTTFIGRERELEEVRELLRRVRILSLTGAGGSGKTRLAIEAANSATEDFPDGVAWADLASLERPELLAQRVAGATGFAPSALLAPTLERHPPTPSPGHLLAVELGARRMLLVLDGCEHLVDACAALVEELLLGCPHLRILATTREALEIAGEHAWHVPPLSLPDPIPETAEQLLASESARLFAERAQAVRAGFRLDDTNLEAVASICRKLDGIPLAIELAAARVRAFSATDIAGRLDRAFTLLTEGGRTTIPRHRTLRAAIDWSYELLGDEERRFLPRLSVFRGGFSLSAAEEVCGDPGTDTSRTFDLIARLVDRSLLELREGRGAVRYHLLETVRQYAEERLEEGEPGQALHRRHAGFYLALVREAEPFLVGVRRREWIERLSAELDNLRGALAWSREHDLRLHLGMTGSLVWFWCSSRQRTEGARWVEGALALARAAEAAPPPGELANLLFASGALASLGGRPATARLRLEEAVRLSGERDDARLEAYAQTYLHMAMLQQGGGEGAPSPVAWFREAEEPQGLRLALLLHGETALERGEHARAEELANEALALGRDHGVDREHAAALQLLAAVALERGDEGRATELLHESLAALRVDPLDVHAARGLEMLAAIGCAHGELHSGVRLAGAAAAIRAGLGSAVHAGAHGARLERALEAARRQLTPGAVPALLEEGRSMPPLRALELGLALRPAGQEGALGAVDVSLAGTSAARAERPAAAAGGTAAGAAPAALDVRALGPLQIVRDGVALEPEAWRLQKPRELLVYLLGHPAGRTREQITAAFWPAATPGQSKNSFHVTLHHLRKTIGGNEWIVTEADRYRVNPQLQVAFDVPRFEREVASALREPSVHALQTALSLYRGEFLEGEPSGAWHLEQRDRLRILYIEGQLALSGLLLEEERFEECIAALEGAIRADDLREDAHRALITCHARMGRHAEALRHFDHLVRFLRLELDSAPEPATTELVSRVREGRPV